MTKTMNWVTNKMTNIDIYKNYGKLFRDKYHSFSDGLESAKSQIYEIFDGYFLYVIPMGHF